MGNPRNMVSKETYILNYFKTIKAAANELSKKEAFKDLLNRIYANEEAYTKLIDRMTLGSEKSIFNIPKGAKNKTGRADTKYNQVIIEFENDLRKTGEHAKEQLAEYFLGTFKSGGDYNLTLIATDCITWKIFVPSFETFENINSIGLSDIKLEELKGGSFVLNEHNGNDFFYFIDRYLFRTEAQKATLEYIEQDFGLQSAVFINSFKKLKDHFSDVKKYGEVQVSFEQWRKFLYIAYGIEELPENIFLVHTYLSVFAKMLAYTVLTDDDFIDDLELEQIINGSIFEKLNVKNLTDNDFFHWVKSDRSFKELKSEFRLIAIELGNYSFKNVDEDVLKGVYQNLIDLDTRHALGEYYTPDWLCEMVVREMQIKAESKTLDPSCGSGSFLRTVIDKLKNENIDITASELASNVYGIDIHPLSVQIAKTTLLVAIGKDLIRKSKKPVSLNVFLSNTILIPDGVKNLFGGDFTLTIDREKYKLNTQVLEDDRLYDEALNVADALAELTLGKKAIDQETFINNLKKSYPYAPIPVLNDSLYKVYLGLKKTKESGRDSIWKFILQNMYKPYFLKERFDFIVGNPPWFTWSSIKKEDYQDELRTLAESYLVMPERKANFPHLEIAAIFLAHCSNYFLKENGQLAFVLPRSFMSADQHENTRNGKAKGFTLTQIWDLDNVTNLFRVPSCVLFTEKKQKTIASQYHKGIKGKSFKGRIKKHNCSIKEVEEAGILSQTDNNFYYTTLGKSSAFSVSKQSKKGNQNQTSHYKALFKQGATIVPRNFYFVELTQEEPEDWDERLINVKTSSESMKQAKKPWNEIDMHGQIDSQYFFRTAISKNVLPFVLYNPELVVLPIKISQENKQISMQTHEEILREGFNKTALWFRDVKNVWDIHKTEKSQKMSANNRIDFQRGITEQDLNKPYLVLYTSSAKNANSCVVKRADYNLNFIADHKVYVLFTNNLKEAFYVSSILNSNVTNDIIKDFQSRGLFGERDVHKTILNVPFPFFDETNQVHYELASLSENCHTKAGQWMKENNIPNNLDPIKLGKVRVQIKDHLNKEMLKIDKLVKAVIK